MTTSSDRDSGKLLHRIRNKNLREVLTPPVEQGWVLFSRKGHIVCLGPDGESIVTSPWSPSSYRSISNLRSRFRRAGVRY